jgi:hypothetical protein
MEWFPKAGDDPESKTDARFDVLKAEVLDCLSEVPESKRNETTALIKIRAVFSTFCLSEATYRYLRCDHN